MIGFKSGLNWDRAGRRSLALWMAVTLMLAASVARADDDDAEPVGDEPAIEEQAVERPVQPSKCKDIIISVSSRICQTKCQKFRRCNGKIEGSPSRTQGPCPAAD
jgi:hypothetical protein